MHSKVFSNASLEKGEWGTFSELWNTAVRYYGSEKFLLFQGESGPAATWTYSEFDMYVDKVAGRLWSMGLRPKQSFHVCLKNSPAFIALWLAAAKLGAWFVPVDPESSPREIASHVRRTSSTIGVCAATRSKAYLAGIEGTDLESSNVIQVSETATDFEDDSVLLGAALPDAITANNLGVANSDRLAVMFTSGTTSQPKGVLLTQENYACVGKVMAQAAGLESHHRWLVTLPLFHGNAQYYCFAPAIAVGASVALTGRFSASRWVDQARNLSATHASLFAAPIRMILARTLPGAPPAELQHMWFAQSLGPSHFEKFSQLISQKPRQLYGMTETIAVVTYDDASEPTFDSIGRVTPGREARLVDPLTFQPVKRGENGLIAVRGQPGVDLFEGYLDDPETTARSFMYDDANDQWFLTGDLATEDQYGCWSFVGRVDDVIKVAGENVSLTELESAIAEAPGVLEAAAVAKSDPIRDVVPVAYVVPQDQKNPPTIEGLKQWSQANLAPAARPRIWYLIDELPRTSVGKIRRFQLQDQGAQA